MCGRYALKSDPKQIAAQFGVDQAVVEGSYLGMFGGSTISAEQITAQNLLPSFNIAPTHQIPAIVQTDNQRIMATFQWGLIPSWAKDPSIGSRMINARVETVLEKPSFRSAAAKRHCIIPADGWFEWQTVSKSKKVPHYFSRPDKALLGFAGIYESWKTPDGTELWTCSVITTDASPEFSQIHDRMPLLVPADSTELWLTQGVAAVAELEQHAVPAAELTQWQVGTAVGQVRNNNPQLIEPVEPDNDSLLSFL
jgi:putative SOS response-associated peptidase YedK